MSENDILLEIVQKEFQQSPRHSRGCAYDYTHRGLSFSTATYVPSRCLNISSTVDNSTLSSCSLMDRPREVDNIGHKGKYFMLQWKRYNFELWSESYSSKYAFQEACDKFKKKRMVNYIARV